MTPGEALLWLALAAGAAALARPRLGAWVARLHAASVIAALALLAASFLLVDLSYAYVWAHTSPDYAWGYRLAGVWGGEEGTLLLWNAGVAGALLVLLRPGASDLRRRASVALLAFSASLTVVSLVVRALAATPGSALAAAPHGRGLADVLLTPFMVIHPPVQFLAYALLAVPGAYAVAHLWGGGEARAWTSAAYPWARVAWLLATLGLGLGAMWAYYVLSFGGYWAWDPVETSNLLPWLALTAFVHAAKHHMRFGDLGLSSHALGLAAPLLAVFASFATRSGLWASVHAFTDPTDRFEPDAAARLLAILEVHAPTRAVLALLTAGALLAAALLARHHAGRLKGPASAYLRGHAVLAVALAGAAAADVRGLWGLALGTASLVGVGTGLALLAGWLLGAPLLLAYLEQEAPRIRAWLDARRVMTLAVALFAVALAVTFVLNVQVVDRPDRARFDVRAPFVVLPLVSVLTVMMALPPLGPRGALALAGAGAVAGLALWALVDDHRVVALSAPFLAAAGAAVLLRLGRALGGRRVRGGALLLLGILLVAIASNPPTHVAGARVPSGPWVAAAGILAGALALVGGVVAARGKLDAPRLRETGIALIHLAVVLGLLGYAASTYSQSRETFAAVPLGTQLHVGGHHLVLGAATVTEEAGMLAAVRVPVELGDGGDASLDFSWRGPPASHYAPRLEVRRGLTEDVYLAPLAFHTPSGWVGGGSAGARVPVGEVDAVTFTASVLPLVGLVWAGLWVSVVGMALILLGAVVERRVRQG